MFRGLASWLGINRVVAALSIARLGDAVGNSLLFIVIPLYVAHLPAPWLPLSETMRVGILLSTYGLLSAIGEPLTGALVDRIGHHKLLIQLGLLLMAGSTLAFILVHHFVGLLVLRGVQGIGLAVTVPATFALMAAVTRRETRGRAMGFLSTLRMLGMALGPLLGGLIQTYLGFHATFYVGAGLVLVAVACVQVWVKEPDRPATPELPAEDRPGFFDRRVWSAGVVCAAGATLTMASAFTVMTTLEKQFNARLHIDAFLFGVAFSSLTVSRLLCQIPVGWLSDRWGRRPVIVVGLLLLAPATALIGWADHLWELIGLRILQGLASAGVAAPAFALAADSARTDSQGRQMSLVTLGFSLGLAVGPLLAGFLAEVFFELPFLVGGGLCLAGAWGVYRFAPETVRPAPAAETASGAA